MSTDTETTTAPAAKVIPEIASWPYEFPLSRPIQTAEDTTQVLVLNEPTAADAFKYGLLTGLSADQVRPLVAHLAVIPPPFIDRMPAADVIALAARLSRFFNRAAA